MGVMNEDRLTLYDGLIKTHITNTTVAKETGKGLSTNDYTTTEKNKLAGIADGANKTIVDSALDASSENPVQNKVIAGEINTLKKSVSDGKTLVATAITDKGVETAADATFAVMAENIGQIETGGGELHGATISVTTSDARATSITATLSKSSTTIEQKNFDSNGTCTFTDIQETGDYTLTASIDAISNSTTVTVTSDNIVNKTVIAVTIELTLDGSTATPLNDVSIWLRTDSTGSSLNAGYTTLAQVIADPNTLNNLMGDLSAMQYLARSTGFADEGCASETFMTYLGASSHVNSTVLNSDYWVSKIKASQYWDKIYTQQFTIHAGAYETITISGYGGSFTTNANGTVTHALPLGTITLKGSVSGRSFTRTITTNTTDVYVMPDGALYWYGNECIEWNIDFTYNPSHGAWNIPTKMYLSTNAIEFNINGIMTMNLCFSQKIDLTNLDKIYARVEIDQNNGETYTPVYLMVTTDAYHSFGNDEIITMTQINESGEHILELDVSNLSEEAYIRLQAQNHHWNTVYQNVGRYTEIYCA